MGNRTGETVVNRGANATMSEKIYRYNDRHQLTQVTDALDSPIALTDASRNIAARYAYDAFGQYRRNENIDTDNVFGFTGHEYDKDTELLYAKARYYDPETARFLSQDPFEGTLNTPPSLHKYLYAYQNPTVYVDPDGRFPVTQQVAAWLNQRASDNTAALRSLQADHGSTLGTRSLAALSGIGSAVFSAAGGTIGLVDIGLDATTANVSTITGREGPQFVQDSVQKTDERREAVLGFVRSSKNYIAQDNLGRAVMNDAKAMGSAASIYAGDVFVRGNLDATASFSGAMFETAFGAAIARGSKLAKIKTESVDSPNWEGYTEGEYSLQSNVGANQTNHGYNSDWDVPVSVDPREIGFSQTTVSYRKTRMAESGEKITYTYDDLVAGMKADGWNGSPLNVVRMPDGSLTSIDNTRLLAAREANIDAQVVIHNYADEISNASALEYARPNMAAPKSWGEAIQSRIDDQTTTYFQDRTFPEQFKYGTIYDPKVTGKR